LLGLSQSQSRESGADGQNHALHLASTFGSLRRFLTALSTVQRCVAAGCRMNRRKKHPNTYQRLFNDLSMTTALA
jgi:hypothetical protein